MSSMTKKFKKCQNLKLDMSIRFKCSICGYEKLIPQKEFKKMTQETFKNNKLFLCDNCNVRMNSISVEVDY